MKRYFVVLIVVILCLEAGITQPGPPPFEATSVLADKSFYRGDCYEIRWNFDNNDIYDIDCPQYNENKNWTVTISKTECNGDCWISYDVLMNELEILKLGDFAYLDNYSTTIDLKPYILDEYNKRNGNKLEIAILMTKHCLSNPLASETTLIYHKIQIVGKNNGGTYSIYDEPVLEDPPGMLHPCEEARKDQDWFLEYVTCCGATRTIQFGWDSKIITQSGHPGTTTLAVSFGASGIGGSLEQEYQVPIQFLEKVKFSGSFSSVTLKGGMDGICYYPAIVVTYAKVIERIMEADCDPRKPDQQIGIKEHFFPANFALLADGCESYKHCKQQGGKLLHQKRSGGIIARNNCSGKLIMDYSNKDEVYTYTWILPDGTTIDGGEELEINEPGLYKCIVQDMCCNKFEFQFNNCDKLTYGQWYYNSGSKQYCREVTCQCGDVVALRESNTYTQCVSPSRYDGGWNFDNGKKKCTKHAYWTDQDGNEIDLTSAVVEADIEAGDENVVKEPDVIEYYDEWSQQCIREYRCDDDSPGFKEEEDPTYGVWKYDEWSEKCYREIFCFESNDPAKDKNGWEVSDEAEGEVNWEFQENDFTCYGIVYCDNEETDIELEIDPEMEWYWNEGAGKCKTKTIECDDIEQENEVFEDPSDIGDWEYDDFWEICIRDVYCETAGETYEDLGTTAYSYDENNYADCDEEEGEYSYKVYCGVTETDIYICRDVPPGSLPPGQNYEASNNITSTSENKSVDKDKENYKYFRIHVFSIDGRDRKRESVKNVSDIDNYISFFKKFRAHKNIKYFYSVYGENKFLYSKRFVIFK